MSHLFPQYGLFLILAALVLFIGATIEAGVPVVPAAQVIVARYPLCLRLLCGVFLVISLFFALALASVQRESILSRLGIWSLLGVPSLALSAEVLGRRITLGGGSVSRLSFYQHRFSRQQASVSGVTYDKTLGAFKVRFTDGATLRLPIVMRGSQQVAHSLTPPA